MPACSTAPAAYARCDPPGSRVAGGAVTASGGHLFVAGSLRRRGGHRNRGRDQVRRIGQVRFKIYDAGYEASVAALRDAMGDEELQSAWAEGFAVSADEAIAYAQRRRGERKRPASGWASLTPGIGSVVRRLYAAATAARFSSTSRCMRTTATD